MVELAFSVFADCSRKKKGSTQVKGFPLALLIRFGRQTALSLSHALYLSLFLSRHTQRCVVCQASATSFAKPNHILYVEMCLFALRSTIESKFDRDGRKNHTYCLSTLFSACFFWTFPTTKYQTTWHSDEKSEEQLSPFRQYPTPMFVLLIASDATSLLHEPWAVLEWMLKGCCILPDGKPKIGSTCSYFCYSQTNVRGKTDQHTVHGRPFLILSFPSGNKNVVSRVSTFVYCRSLPIGVCCCVLLRR